MGRYSPTFFFSFFRYPNETAVEEALATYYADGNSATDGIPPNVRSVLEERKQVTGAQRKRRGPSKFL